MIEIAGTVCFAIAVIVSLALRDVELPFAVCALGFLTYFGVHDGGLALLHYVKHLDFAPAVKIFAVIVIMGSPFVLKLADRFILSLVKLIRLSPVMSYFAVVMIIGPLIGSLISEPAAMAISALLLLNNYFLATTSNRLKYAMLGLLFVNISIGGTLTNFAAPPIVMVAGKWSWNSLDTLRLLGWRSTIAVIANTMLVLFIYRVELRQIKFDTSRSQVEIPSWRDIAKSGFYVGIFLATLIVLGDQQVWWVQPLLIKLSGGTIYFASTLLTSVIDNAAITYIGAQAGSLSDSAKYMLVAGSITGGGLTVLANAPNPAGYRLLKSAFGERGINPLKLLAGAIVPTLVAIVCFYFL